MSVSSTVDCVRDTRNAALCENDAHGAPAQWSSHFPLHTEHAGFSVLAADDTVVAWFACILDAGDLHKALSGPGKVVRCADGEVMRYRQPRRSRPL